MNENLHALSNPPLKSLSKSGIISSLFFFLFLCSYAKAVPGTFVAGPCPPISTLDCSALTVGMPYSLSFNAAVSGTIADKNGAGTGFTTVNTYTGTRLSADGAVSNASVPGYTPSKITVTGGRIQIVASKGIDFQTNNNQINTLGVRILASQKFQVEVKVVNPFNGSQSEQAGLWYGLNDKTFLKLGISGNKVELRREVNDVSSSSSTTTNPDQRKTATISSLNTKTVWLRMIIDAGANTVEGFYSTDGVTYSNAGAGYPSTTLSLSGTGLTSGEQYAGIFSTYRNGTAAVTYTYDDFAVSSLVTQSASINFRPSGSSAPAGYTADNGLAFDATRKFGWVSAATKAPLSYAANTRLRTGTADARQLSLIQMQATTDNTTPGAWEYVVANGTYRVTVSAGDNNFYNSIHQLNIEGLPTVSDFTGSASGARFKVATATVQVTDGKLTVDATGGTNTKMNYITFAPATAVSDASAPTASARFSGTLRSAGVYDGPVKVFMTATDNGVSGLKTFQYALNGGSFTNYTAPFTVTAPGNYSYVIRATDGNNNTTTTSAYTFTIYAPPAAGAYMVLKNLDNFPANDQLTFSRILIPWRRTSPVTPYNENHDVVKLRVSSKGSGPLTISNLALSNPGAWKIIAISSDSSAATPVNVGPGSFVDIAIRFVAVQDAAVRVTVFHDTLTINSNDGPTPARKVVLHGLYQKSGEGKHEPWAQEIINAFGFVSKTGYDEVDNGNDGTSIMPGSHEIAASYFVRADNTKPVKVYQLAAYHGCCAATESFRYFAKGSATLTTLFTHDPVDGQSLSPRIRNSNSLAQGTFTPTGSFGIKLGSTSSSDRTQNGGQLIGIRFLKVIDANGNVVPNAYFVNHDYINNSSTNYDYQDNIYYIENVKPEAGTVNYSDLAATNTSAINFAATLAGATSSSSVTLKNMGTTYSNGSSDPAIQIKGVTITGPNAAEFSVNALSTTSLAVQATTSLTVRFSPSSVGIKNAVVLVHYNNSRTPLRIPVYGIGNNSTSTVTLVRRIKGGSDTGLTVGGNTYEKDDTYRVGSIKLDAQVTASGIAGTDIDQLYQTYLSAATDLAETGYDIPVTSNGTYLVRMHFVENFWSETGARVFTTTMEGTNIQSNFDIFSEVGYRAALVKDFVTTVNDGVMTIRYKPSVNRVAIAAIEIFRVVNNAGRIGAEEPELVAETGDKVLDIYPNPNAGSDIQLNLKNFGKNEAVNINMFNLSGQVIKQESAKTDALGSAALTIRLRDKPAKGLYIIRAESVSGAVVSKILME